MAGRGQVVFGLHAASAAIDRRLNAVQRAIVLGGQLRGPLADLVTRLEAARIPVERVARRELDRLTAGGVHQGIVLELPAPRELGIRELEDLVEGSVQPVNLLVLDQVEDPRNLGACLRTADAAGVDGVVIPKARSAKLSEAALKTAAGAAETVPLFVVPNLARALNWLKDAGVTLVGAAEEAPSTLFDLELEPPIAIVLGAEGKGLRRLTREACDALVRIPMAGSVESLNVSVAAGVILFELVRQSGLR